MFGYRISCIFIAALIPFAAAAELEPASINAAGYAELGPGDQIQPAIVKAQILLDRAEFSPGEIDGRHSARLDQAIAAFAERHGLPVDTGWSRSFWLALTSSVTGPVIAEYSLTREDLKGPFMQLPAKMEDMRSFRTLGFSSAREALAEKFHVGEELLAVLNSGASFSDVGERILVPNVLPDRSPGIAARIDVDKDRQTVKVYSAQNELIAFFPASVGSDDKPSPSGALKVKLIESDPSYHYNPKYQFKEIGIQKPFDLKPGPNNPLGTTWIALSKPGYGIHGTSEPSLVGKSASHGCVRLTNWDARRLAGMLTKGIPVNFKQRSEAHAAFDAH
ncbi:L,D-transpeptidase family protein [Bradyrhizobium sp. STM 3562]|uniref:L,D-transpeptidase family protein n=1 Tax=Bradyrhizobium sp. STM 3562 TaxID=578924 RepID=UPI00388E763F